MDSNKNSAKELVNVSSTLNEKLPLPNFNILNSKRRYILELERDLHLTTFGNEGEMEVFDVPVNYKGNHYIHTIRFGSMSNKKVIVLTHGYNSNIAILCRITKLLASEYRVYAFDWLGHGLSSRELLNFKTLEETLDFFIESIEIWRKFLGIEKFHFAGHSMGGYLGVNYCLRYPNVLTKISMISPAGITDPLPSDEIYRDNSVMQVFGFKILELFHGVFTVKDIYRKLGCLRKPVYDFLHRTGYRNTGSIISEKINLYNYHLLDLEGNIESELSLIFSKYIPLLQFPLEHRIDKLHSSVDIYYGSEDWMERIGAERVVKRFPNKFKMIVVKDSGHNIFMDQPEVLSEYLIKNYDYVEERISPKKKYNELVSSISRDMMRINTIKKNSLRKDSMSTVVQINNIESEKLSYKNYLSPVKQDRNSFLNKIKSKIMNVEDSDNEENVKIDQGTKKPTDLKLYPDSPAKIEIINTNGERTNSNSLIKVTEGDNNLVETCNNVVRVTETNNKKSNKKEAKSYTGLEKLMKFYADKGETIGEDESYDRDGDYEVEEQLKTHKNTESKSYKEKQYITVGNVSLVNGNKKVAFKNKLKYINEDDEGQETDEKNDVEGKLEVVEVSKKKRQLSESKAKPSMSSTLKQQKSKNKYRKVEPEIFNREYENDDDI